MDEKSLLEQGLHTPPDALYTGDPAHDLDRWDRPYSGTIAAGGNSVTLPNDQTGFGGRVNPLLRMASDYWILRLAMSANGAGVIGAAETILLQRDGGQDFTVYLDCPQQPAGSGNVWIGAEKRYVLPGSLRLKITNNSTTSILYYSVTAIRGYDPASIF